MINSKEIQKKIMEHWVLKHHCHYVCTNFSGVGYDECDVIAVNPSGFVYEFEVKMSRSDFFADFKKLKHQFFKRSIEPGNLELLLTKIPNNFYFAVPFGLVKAEEVPDYAGLLYFKRYQIKGWKEPLTEFEIVRKAPRIHKDKASQDLINRICRTLSQRFVFGCALMTYLNKQNEVSRETASQ